MLSHYKEPFQRLGDPVARALLRSNVRPNHLTVVGLGVSILAACALASGRLRVCALLLALAGLFDFFDGSLARLANRVSAFGAFLDSVVDRYSDLALFMGLLVYYASINRFFYIVLTAVVMTGSVMVSYTRARAENSIPTCKVGFMERPERVVLLIIGALSDRIPEVLWVIAVLANLTVVQRMVFTWQEAKRLEEAQLRPPPVVRRAKA